VFNLLGKSHYSGNQAVTTEIDPIVADHHGAAPHPLGGAEPTCGEGTHGADMGLPGADGELLGLLFDLRGAGGIG